MPKHKQSYDDPEPKSLRAVEAEQGANDYRDTPEFKAYQLQVIGVLSKAKRPVNTRYIHSKLGYDLDKWTADVLEMTTFILRIPGYIDLFTYEPDIQVRVTPNMTVKDGNALPFLPNKRKRLFNKGRYEAEGFTV